MRDEGHKVGVLSANVLRPFPADLFRKELSGVKAIVVGDRADSYGADGGNLSLEVRAAIQIDPDNRTRVLTRIYGLGGKDFDDSDAEQFFKEALEVVETGRVDEHFVSIRQRRMREKARKGRRGVVAKWGRSVPRGDRSRS